MDNTFQQSRREKLTTLNRRTTTVTELSPAAQVAMDAALTHSGPAFEPLVRKMLASAFRAAADQVVSKSTEPNRTINIEPEKDVVFIGAWHIWNTQRKVRSQLLAIAAELSDTSPTREENYDHE
jgi:hypothetical protein